MIGRLFNFIGRNEVISISHSTTLKPFSIGLKRPKLSDTFKYPMHTDQFDQSNYNLNQDKDQDPAETEMRDKKYNSVYEKLLNTSAEDIIQSQWRTSQKIQQKKLSQFMQNSSDRDIMNATKAFIQNYGKKRSAQMSDLFKEKRIDDQYSDYQKYKQNYVTKQKQGYQQIDKDLFKTRDINRYAQFLSKTNLPQGKASAQITRQKVNKILSKLNSNYNLNQIQQELKNVIYDEKQYPQYMTPEEQVEQIKNPAPICYQKITRLSYFARQQIYIRYLQGWTVKELSLRYGILPQRVKAVVWLRHYFWETIYPKMGDIALKLSIQMELQSQKSQNQYFAQQYLNPTKPRQYDSENSDQEDQYHARRQMIVDYGVDLQNFQAFQAGLHCVNYQRSQFDFQVKPEDRYKILKVFRNQIRSQRYKIIPERFIGKKGRGYLLQRIDQFRGKSSMKPNRLFNDILQYGTKKEMQHLLPDRVRKNLKKGPRIAGFIQKQKKVDKTRVP